MQLACQNRVIKLGLFKTNFCPRFKAISKKKSLLKNSGGYSNLGARGKNFQKLM